MITFGPTTRITAPTIGDVRGSLQQVLQEEFDPVWTVVCAAVPVAVTVEQLDEEGLDRFIAALAEQGPLCRVVAMSWKIRRTAARKLAELGR